MFVRMYVYLSIFVGICVDLRVCYSRFPSIGLLSSPSVFFFNLAITHGKY